MGDVCVFVIVMTVSQRATVYRNESSERFTATLSSGEVAYITNRANKAHTKGLVVYEVIHLAHSYLSDRLTFVEDHIYKTLADVIGVTQSDDVRKKNIFNEEADPIKQLKYEADSADYSDYSEMKKTVIYLPVSTIETLKEENGPRGVSQAISEAIHQVIRMPYNTRFNKLTVIDQFIKINNGDKDNIEELHPFVELLIDGDDEEYNIRLSDRINSDREREDQLLREDLKRRGLNLDSQTPWVGLKPDMTFNLNVLRRIIRLGVLKQKKDVRVRALKRAIEGSQKLREDCGQNTQLYVYKRDFYDHIEEIFDCSRPTAKSYGDAVFQSFRSVSGVYDDGKLERLIVKPYNSRSKFTRTGMGQPYACLNKKNSNYSIEYKHKFLE